jgi:hypothetical protein
MRITLLCIVLSFFFFNCKDKTTYNCTVTHHTNIGAGVDFVFDKEFTGTYEEMLAYEAENTDSTQTTTCQ